MEQLPFTITRDPARGFVEATLRGFWDMAMLDAFRAEVIRATDMMENAGKRPLLLVDARAHGVQSKEVVEGLRAFASSAAGLKRRTAVLVDGALYRMQASRIRSADVHQVFADPHEARQWLLDEHQA